MVGTIWEEEVEVRQKGYTDEMMFMFLYASFYLSRVLWNQASRYIHRKSRRTVGGDSHYICLWDACYFRSQRRNWRWFKRNPLYKQLRFWPLAWTLKYYMVGHDGNALSINMYTTIEERLSKTKPIFTKWLNHIQWWEQKEALSTIRS